MKISKLRSVFPKAHVLALTGTATTKTIKTIKGTMALRNVKVVKTSIMRNNIKLNVNRRQPTNTHIWQMGLSPKYIHDPDMTLTFDLNIKIVFSQWIWIWQDVFVLWHRHTKFLHMGVSPWDMLCSLSTLVWLWPFILFEIKGGTPNIFIGEQLGFGVCVAKYSNGISFGIMKFGDYERCSEDFTMFFHNKLNWTIHPSFTFLNNNFIHFLRRRYEFWKF